MPNSITSIGGYVFSGCSSLTSIELPNSITSIGWGAFEGCSSLTSIELPNSVTIIDHEVFSGCSSLTSIELPNSITIIGWGVFSGCSSLTSIELPNSITRIGWDFFSGCSSLTSIKLPNSVTSISEEAFRGCSSLTIYCYAGSYAETYAKEQNIPYKIIYSSDIPADIEGKVLYINRCEEEAQQIIFGEIPLNVPGTIYSAKITEVTDLSFFDSFNELLHTYALVEIDDNGNLLWIKPLVRKVGEITSASSYMIEIDNTSYQTSFEVLMPDFYLNRACIYYLYEDVMVRMNVLEQKTGTFEKWNGLTKQITIDGKTYDTDFIDLSFLAAIDLWLNHKVTYEFLGEVIYRITPENYNTENVKKLQNYDVFTNTVYFEDGSSYVVAEDVTISINELIGKWVTFTLRTSMEGGVELTNLKEFSTSLKVTLEMLNGDDIFYSEGKYSYDKITYQSKADFEIPFRITIQNVPSVTVKSEELKNDKSLARTINQVIISEPTNFNFGWWKEGVVDTSKPIVLHVDESWTGTGFIRVGTFYDPALEKNREQITCTVETENNKITTEKSFTIANLDKSSKLSNETKKEIQKVIELSAKQQLISPPFGSLLTKDQCDQLNAVLAQWICVITDDDIDIEVKRMLFDTYKESNSVIESSIIVPIVINNRQYPNKGTRRFKFSVKYNDIGDAFQNYLDMLLEGSLSRIDWELLDKENMKGVSDGILYVDAKADLQTLQNEMNEAIKQVKEDMKEAIEEDMKIVSSTLDEVLDDFLDSIDNDLERYAMSCAFEITKEKIKAIVWHEESDYIGAIKGASKKFITKKLTIKCPVDIYLYYNGELKGVVKDDQIDSSYEIYNMGSYLSVNGDTKSVYLPDENFSIKLVGNNTGSMDYIIEEYEEGENPTLLRTVYFDNLPLEKGKVYTGNLEEGVGKDKSVYALSSDGEVIEANYDTALGDEIIDKPAIDSKPSDDDKDNNGNHSGADKEDSETDSKEDSDSEDDNDSTIIANTNSKLNKSGSWIKDQIGWWYQNADNSYPANKWQFIDNKWYFFNKAGYMVTGWILSNNKWYYLGTDGAMVENSWILYKEKWYFLKGGNGDMATGWILWKNQWYYLNPDGAMKTGWFLDKDIWYYLNKNGDMAVSCTTPDGYQVDKNGAWIK